MFTAGYLLFVGIFTLAFWLLIFLSGFALPYAITVWTMHKIRTRGKKKDHKVVS